MAYQVSYMWMGAPASFALDAGFPKNTNVAPVTNGASSINSSTFSTTGVKKIVVTAAWSSYDTDGSPIGLAWNGGTPGNASAFSLIGRTPQWTGPAGNRWNQAGIWEATTTGDLTGVSVTASRGQGTSGTGDCAEITIYSFSGAGAAGTPTILVGENVATVYRATLTTASGSYVLATACVGADQSVANNPEAGQTGFSVSQNDWCAAAYKVASGSSTTIGWGGGAQGSYVSFVAVAIPAA